jgi:adenine phosphoribosyltransferase
MLAVFLGDCSNIPQIMDLKEFIRDVPDFPKPGVVFKDISPLLASPDALMFAVRELANRFQRSGANKILGAEARGFIFGAALACEMGLGFVPVRKPGKLPSKTLCVTYDLEYGTDTLCVHEDAVVPGEKVLVIDDVLATGGTIAGILQLMEKSRAEVVGIGFVLELAFLNGREKLGSHQPEAILTY